MLTSSRSPRSTCPCLLPGRPAPAPRTGRAPDRAPDRGSATAETAVLLPVLLVVLAAAVAVLVCVAAQLQCVDAARAGARVAARGDSPALVQQAAQRLAPDGAQVVQDREGDTVEVRVTARVRPFGRALAVLPAVLVRGRAAAAVEGAGP